MEYWDADGNIEHSKYAYRFVGVLNDWGERGGGGGGRAEEVKTAAMLICRSPLYTKLFSVDDIIYPLNNDKNTGRRE